MNYGHINYKHPYDPTGMRFDNLVRDEYHPIEDPTKLQAFLLRHGAFYTSSVRARLEDGTVLTPYVDFQFSRLADQVVRDTGMDAAYVVRMKKHYVGSIVFTYQCVGGEYTDIRHFLTEHIETFQNDARGLWWENTHNKPVSYFPHRHLHHIHDVFGFDELVHPLKRYVDILTARHLREDRITFVKMKALRKDVDGLITNNNDQLNDINGKIGELKAFVGDKPLATVDALNQLANTVATNYSNYVIDKAALLQKDIEIQRAITDNTNLIVEKERDLSVRIDDLNTEVNKESIRRVSFSAVTKSNWVEITTHGKHGFELTIYKNEDLANLDTIVTDIRDVTIPGINNSITDLGNRLSTIESDLPTIKNNINTLFTFKTTQEQTNRDTAQSLADLADKDTEFDNRLTQMNTRIGEVISDVEERLRESGNNLAEVLDQVRERLDDAVDEHAAFVQTMTNKHDTFMAQQQLNNAAQQRVIDDALRVNQEQQNAIADVSTKADNNASEIAKLKQSMTDSGQEGTKTKDDLTALKSDYDKFKQAASDKLVEHTTAINDLQTNHQQLEDRVEQVEKHLVKPYRFLFKNSILTVTGHDQYNVSKTLNDANDHITVIAIENHKLDTVWLTGNKTTSVRSYLQTYSNGGDLIVLLKLKNTYQRNKTNGFKSPFITSDFDFGLLEEISRYNSKTPTLLLEEILHLSELDLFTGRELIMLHVNNHGTHSIRILPVDEGEFNLNIHTRNDVSWISISGGVSVDTLLPASKAALYFQRTDNDFNYINNPLLRVTYEAGIDEWSIESRNNVTIGWNTIRDTLFPTGYQPELDLLLPVVNILSNKQIVSNNPIKRIKNTELTLTVKGSHQVLNTLTFGYYNKDNPSQEYLMTREQPTGDNITRVKYVYKQNTPDGNYRFFIRFGNITQTLGSIGYITLTDIRDSYGFNQPVPHLDKNQLVSKVRPLIEESVRRYITENAQSAQPQFDLSQFVKQPGAEDWSNVEVGPNNELLATGVILQNIGGDVSTSVFAPLQTFQITNTQEWVIPSTLAGRKAEIIIRASSVQQNGQIIHSAVRRTFVVLPKNQRVTITVGAMTSFGPFLSVSNMQDYSDALFPRSVGLAAQAGLVTINV